MAQYKLTLDADEVAVVIVAELKQFLGLLKDEPEKKLRKALKRVIRAYTSGANNDPL